MILKSSFLEVQKEREEPTLDDKLDKKLKKWDY